MTPAQLQVLTDVHLVATGAKKPPKRVSRNPAADLAQLAAL